MSHIIDFSRFSPSWFFLAPDDGVSANGAPAHSSHAANTTSTDADTSASDGKNTGSDAEGAETASAPANADNGKADTPNAETTDADKPESSNGFRAITSQADLDRIVKERLERQKLALEAKRKKDELEKSGKWEELYKESQTAHETALAETQKQLDELQTQLAKREQDAGIERAISAHKLDKDAAELFREAVEGRALDAAELNKRAEKFAKAMAAPVAPSTENGAQNTATSGAATKQDHYSFNPQGGVKW